MALYSGLTISSASYGTAYSMAMAKLGASLHDITMRGQLRFYYKYENEHFYRVVVDSALQAVANTAKNQLIKQAKNLMTKKKKDTFTQKVINGQKQKLIEKGIAQNTESTEAEYGKMEVLDIKGDKKYVFCRDFYGNFCPDGLMMKIPTKEAVKYSISRTIYGLGVKPDGTPDTDGLKDSSEGYGEFESKNIVWYDPTALISINTDKNIVLTKVAGRDYSRKELISNGDISFSVSGHILSQHPDVYPENEVQKLIQCFKYKGIVEVNNLVLGQWKINKILIKDLNLPSMEGAKGRQDYSFNAVGIQPDSEGSVTEDTLEIDEYISANETPKEESAWVKFMKDMAKGTASQLTEFADSVASNAIDKYVKLESLECKE